MAQDQKILDLVKIAKQQNSNGQPTAAAEHAFNKILKILEPELRKIAARWYITGGDHGDVMQEGRIGLWKAVLDFDESKKMSFKNFSVGLCAKRNVITALTAAKRKKYDLHNNAISLDTPVSTGDDEPEQTLADFIRDGSSPMIDNLLAREEFEENSERVKRRLTQLELAVYEEYTHEESYKDIAEALGLKSKAIDNALMRVRKKSSEVYSDYLSRNQADKDREDFE